MHPTTPLQALDAALHRALALLTDGQVLGAPLSREFSLCSSAPAQQRSPSVLNDVSYIPPSAQSLRSSSDAHHQHHRPLPLNSRTTASTSTASRAPCPTLTRRCCARMSCGSGGCGSCGSGVTADDDPHLLDVESLVPSPSNPFTLDPLPFPLDPQPLPSTTPSLPSLLHSAALDLTHVQAAERAGHADEEATAALLSLFSDVGWAMAGGNAQAMKPLLAVFDECGPAAFLDLCQRLVRLRCTGHLLAWAFDFVQHDPLTLVRIVGGGDGEEEKEESGGDEAGVGEKGEGEAHLLAMVAAVNGQAAFYECFAGNAKVGRMRVDADALR